MAKQFKRCNTNGPQTWAEFLAHCEDNGWPCSTAKERAVVKTTWERVRRCENWMDDTYHVTLDTKADHGFEGVTVWHLSIKRHDKQPMNDWREMQEIKNAICGDEVEAIQLYPAESRLVDTSNQYHLFAFMTVKGLIGPQKLPIGFADRLVTDTPFKGGKRGAK